MNQNENEKPEQDTALIEQMIAEAAVQPTPPPVKATPYQPARKMSWREKAKLKKATASTSIKRDSTPMPTAPTSTAVPKGARKRRFVYRPLQDGDRIEAEFICNEGSKIGVPFKFPANVPVEVADNVCIQQLLTEKFETRDGLIQSRTAEKMVPLYKVLAGNPYFEIDGVRPERVEPFAKLPDTSDEYRNWAIAWIYASTSSQSMDIRWAGEEGLRQRCGVTNQERNQLFIQLQNRRRECAEMERGRAFAA